jgi:hypothetical protein
VSVSAVTCAPRFDDARNLELTWKDHAGHRTRLATVRAYPSGAFERDVTIPTTSTAGGGEVVVSGVETPCADTGSCAAYAAYLEVVDSSPDFGTSNHANQVAAAIAEQMQSSVEHRPSFAAIAIVPDGIELVLRTTHVDAETAVMKQAFETAKASVPAADRAVADAARLHIARVQHSDAALQLLSTRILHDAAWQKRHRIELSRWAADPATDSVRIFLRSYSDASAVLLVERYGPAVTVSTKDTPFAIAS